jgi:hypothetical protein
MSKSLKTLTALALFMAPVAVMAGPNEKPAPVQASFTHEGERYVYAVETKGDLKIIRGTTERTGRDFVLYVSDKKVTGTVDNQYVSFPLSAIAEAKSKLAIASR